MGRSALTQHATELFVDAEVSDGPIIIYGEKGTGKVLVAKAIHEICNRKSGPFVKVTCAVLSETLLKNERFCHVRALTPARISGTKSECNANALAISAPHHVFKKKRLSKPIEPGQSAIRLGHAFS